MTEIVSEKFKDNFYISKFDKILNKDIFKIDKKDIKGTGYVVDTLECSLYSFINSKNYIESVVTKICFGDDTDTTACITGGLAGLYYGYNSIPKRWIEKLARKDDLLTIISKFKNKYEIK